jgi:hypothetical protein
MLNDFCFHLSFIQRQIERSLLTFLLPEENPKSTKLGATTWNAGISFPPFTNSVKILVTSMKLPGQPWTNRSGIAFETLLV